MRAPVVVCGVIFGVVSGLDSKMPSATDTGALWMQPEAADRTAGDTAASGGSSTDNTVNSRRVLRRQNGLGLEFGFHIGYRIGFRTGLQTRNGICDGLATWPRQAGCQPDG